MIRRIGLSNVRIFNGPEWSFELSPLTVFCGVNSAGKSTLLKIPLLIQQSQSESRGRLRLAGSRVDFGNYHTFVSQGKTDKKVVISITTDLTLVSSTIDFLQPKKSRKKGEPPPEVVARPCEITCEFTFCAPDQNSSPGTKSSDGVDLSAVLDRANFSLTTEDSPLLQWRVQRSSLQSRADRHFEIFLPANYFRRAGGFRFLSAEQKGREVQLTTILDGLLPFTIIGKAKGVRSSEGQLDAVSSETEEIQVPLPPVIQQALWSFEGTLNSTSYLGPLRSPAKRYYVAHLEPSRGLDPTGECLPYVLRDRGNDRVINVPPGAGMDKVPQSLEQALNGWVHYLRTGEPLSHSESTAEVLLSTTNQVLVQISIRGVSGQEGYALADSGFGYSQVLPILVRGLLAEEGSAFIVEQPELHLNPSLQVRLAEFFVSMVKCGKQVLIETHSEHIVNAIRVLAAEDELGHLSEKSRIYFIDTSPQRPRLCELSMQKDGTVPNWPRHFFGEAVELTGRLLRAQKRYRASPVSLKN